jgi:hypothetical protein
LKIKQQSKGSGVNTIRAYLASDFWMSNTITWNNKPGYDATAITPTVLGDWYTMNVLSEVRNVYYQFESNYGFVIRDLTENNTNIWSTFYSSDSSNSSNFPVLSITYGTITAYQYFTGSWASGAANLTLFVDSTSNSNYGTEINAVWNQWNGINAKVKIASKSTSGIASNYSIAIRVDNTINSYAETRFYNASGQQALNNATWSRAEILLNTNNMNTLHTELRKETILHELGHAIGLAHVYAFLGDSSVCIMQEYEFYCYPSPTSHDKQTLNAKYT